jgi:hypothetical protein
MKILLISPTSGGIGGIAQHVDGLSQFLTGVNHEHVVLFHRCPQMLVKLIVSSLEKN